MLAWSLPVPITPNASKTWAALSLKCSYYFPHRTHFILSTRCRASWTWPAKLWPFSPWLCDFTPSTCSLELQPPAIPAARHSLDTLGCCHSCAVVKGFLFFPHPLSLDPPGQLVTVGHVTSLAPSLQSFHGLDKLNRVPLCHHSLWYMLIFFSFWSVYLFTFLSRLQYSWNRRTIYFNLDAKCLPSAWHAEEAHCLWTEWTNEGRKEVHG